MELYQLIDKAPEKEKKQKQALPFIVLTGVTPSVLCTPPKICWFTFLFSGPSKLKCKQFTLLHVYYNTNQTKHRDLHWKIK